MRNPSSNGQLAGDFISGIHKMQAAPGQETPGALIEKMEQVFSKRLEELNQGIQVGKDTRTVPGQEAQEALLEKMEQLSKRLDELIQGPVSVGGLYQGLKQELLKAIETMTEECTTALETKIQTQLSAMTAAQCEPPRPTFKF